MGIEEEIEGTLSELPHNAVLCLPAVCCRQARLRPNVGDKGLTKELWLGRVFELTNLMTARLGPDTLQPAQVQRSLLQAASRHAEARQIRQAQELMALADSADGRLRDMAAAASTIRSSWRAHHSHRNPLHILKIFAECPVKGHVLLACGSSGMAGDSLRYARMLAAMGFLVVAPDGLAGKSRLRHRDCRPAPRPEQATDYWSPNLLYTDEPAQRWTGSCPCLTGFANPEALGDRGRLTYSSSADAYLADQDKHDELYADVIHLRKAELSHIMRQLPGYILAAGLYLFGMSEGAIALASFHDDYQDCLLGRVLASYSCAPNFWTYGRPENVGFRCMTSLPTLSLVGTEDQYFGTSPDSVAAQVAVACGRTDFAGDGADVMAAHGLAKALICRFQGAKHSILPSHDDAVRQIVCCFLSRPQCVSTLAVPDGLQPNLTVPGLGPTNSHGVYVKVVQGSGMTNLGCRVDTSVVNDMLSTLAKRLYMPEETLGGAGIKVKLRGSQ